MVEHKQNYTYKDKSFYRVEREPVVITDTAAYMTLGYIQRCFRGKNFEVWNAATGGNKFILGDDYVLTAGFVDQAYSKVIGEACYGAFRFKRDTRTVYVSYDCIATYSSGDQINEHEDRLDADDALLTDHTNRLNAIDNKNNEEDSRLDEIETKNLSQDLRLDNHSSLLTEHEGRIDTLEADLTSQIAKESADILSLQSIISGLGSGGGGNGNINAAIETYPVFQKKYGFTLITGANSRISEYNGVAYNCEMYLDGCWVTNLNTGVMQTTLSNIFGTNDTTAVTDMLATPWGIVAVGNGKLAVSTNQGASWTVQALAGTGTSPMLQLAGDKLYINGSIYTTDCIIFTTVTEHGLIIFHSANSKYYSIKDRIVCESTDGISFSFLTLTGAELIGDSPRGFKSYGGYLYFIYGGSTGGVYKIDIANGNFVTKVFSGNTQSLVVINNFLLCSTATGIYQAYNNGSFYQLGNNGSNSMWATSSRIYYRELSTNRILSYSLVKLGDIIPNINMQQGIINPEFKFWLDSSSSTISGAYCGTVHKTIFNGVTGVCSKGTHALGAEKADGNILTNYCIDTITVAGTTTANFYVKQLYIPSVQSYAGKTITIRVRAKANASKYLGVYAYQNFGTGGSPSAAVVIPGKRVTLTTSYVNYDITLNIPEITGKTLGSNGDDHLGFQVVFDGSSTIDANLDLPIGHQTGVFSTALFTVSEGLVPLPYVQRKDLEEINNIRRTWESTYPLGVFPGTITNAGCRFNVASGTSFFYTFNEFFKTTKSRNPAITFYSPLSGAANRIRNTNGYDVAVNNGADITTDGFGTYQHQPSGLVAANLYQYHWVADNRY